MSNVADYLPPGPPDPPRLCPYCDTRRSNHSTPIHKPGCPRHSSNRTPPQQASEPGEGPWEITEEDVQVVAHASPSLGFRDVLETIRDRLRARTQQDADPVERIARALADAAGDSRDEGWRSYEHAASDFMDGIAPHETVQRTQREISREEWDIAVRGLRVDMGQMRHEDAIHGFLNVLGIMPRITDEDSP
jgi:hypothetical protein